MTDSPYAPGQPPQPGPNPYAGPQPPAPGPNPYAAGPQPTPGYGPPMGGQPPVAPKKSNVGKIIAIVAGALVLLLIAGGVILYLTVGRNVVAASHIRVVAPDTLNGRPKSTDADLVKIAQEAQTGLKSDVPSATSTVGAFYGTAEKKDLALLVAVSNVDLVPSTTLDEAVKATNAETPLRDVKDADPGPLGGVAKCGSATTDGIDLGVCMWADGGSAGEFYLYFATAADAAKELGQVRQAVEQKG